MKFIRGEIMAQWQPNPRIIQQESPNESIVLYNGSSEIIIDEQHIESKSIVEITWFPFPRITITINYSGQLCGLGDIELSLTELIPSSQMKVRIFKSQLKHSDSINNNEIVGYLKEAPMTGEINILSSITFYITNFSFFGFSNQSVIELDDKGKINEIKREGWLNFSEQLIFDYENWHIVLAKIDETAKFEEKLKSQGGYGITYICKIENLDNANFNLDEGHEIINSLIYYLSFVRGFWIAPLLISGFDRNGNQLLEDWSSLDIKADLWKSITHPSWITDSIEIANGFPGFMEKWQNEFWKDTIQKSIQWYLESFNHVTGYNTSLVLVQTALDKLAWTYLKSLRSDKYTNKKLDKLTAKEKIKELLENIGVSITPIDNSYPQMNRKKCWEVENTCENIAACKSIEKCKNNTMKCKEMKYQEKVSAITEVRNRIIHPKYDGDRPIHPSQEIIKEAFFISHDYLLKCLLKLFEYPDDTYLILTNNIVNSDE